MSTIPLPNAAKNSRELGDLNLSHINTNVSNSMNNNRMRMHPNGLMFNQSNMYCFGNVNNNNNRISRSYTGTGGTQSAYNYVNYIYVNFLRGDSGIMVMLVLSRHHWLRMILRLVEDFLVLICIQVVI